MRKQYNGFTLLELLIVVAIVAIIAVFALPTYQRQTMHAHRANAQAKMLEIAGLLENHYLQQGSYSQALIDNINADADLSHAPSATNHQYDITVKQTDSGQSYQISATPQNAEARCGVLTLDNFHTQGADDDNCW